MNLKIKICLLLFYTMVSWSFIACSNEDEALPINDDELEVIHSMYVSEVEQGDYKNTYTYENVDGEILLKQIDLYKSGIKKYYLTLKYDDQNRLIECKRSIPTSDYRYHENVIFGDAIPSNSVILYASNQLIITNKDNASEVMTYSLNKDGFAQEMTWIRGNDSWRRTFIREDHDFVSYIQTYSSNGVSRESKFVSIFDDMKSVDYLREILPCFHSSNNILKTTQTIGGDVIGEISYAYTYNSAEYPVVIIKKETKHIDGVEEISRTTTRLKYINASNI